MIVTESAPLSIQQRDRLATMRRAGRLLPPLTYLTRVDDRLAPVDLERALARVQKRHDALRYTFPDALERDAALVLSAHEAHWPLATEATHGDDLEDAIRSVAAEAFGQPLPIRTGPPVAAILVQGPNASGLALAFDHLAFDRLSLQVLRADLGAAFFSSSGSTYAGTPPLQYSDYAHAQQELAESAEGEARISYWRKKLDVIGGYPPLPLKARPTFAEPVTWQPALRLRREIDPVTAGRATAAGAQLGATTFMTWAAAVLAGLRRLHRTRTPGIATSDSGRHQRGSHGAIGFFAYSFPLLVSARRNARARDWLGATRLATLDGLANSIPFRLVSSEPSRPPIANGAAVYFDAYVEHNQVVRLDTGASLINASREPPARLMKTPDIYVTLDWRARVPSLSCDFLESAHEIAFVEALLDATVTFAAELIDA